MRDSPLRKYQLDLSSGRLLQCVHCSLRASHNHIISTASTKGPFYSTCCTFESGCISQIPSLIWMTRCTQMHHNSNLKKCPWRLNSNDVYNIFGRGFSRYFRTLKKLTTSQLQDKKNLKMLTHGWWKIHQWKNEVQNAYQNYFTRRRETTLSAQPLSVYLVKIDVANLWKVKYTVVKS